MRPVLVTSHTSFSPARHCTAADLEGRAELVPVAHAASASIRNIAAPDLNIGKAVRLCSAAIDMYEV